MCILTSKAVVVDILDHFLQRDKYTDRIDMTSRDKKCVVLVTGGTGFLGQHVIGLLQSRASHVTEIRVLDMVPYVNKLDYPANKPVHQFTGSILDVDLVRAACRGVDSVLHIASVIDTSLLPDEKLSYDINVIGTQNIVDACRRAGVKRLIYCSTVDVVKGLESIYEGKETLQRQCRGLFEPYSTTKAEAERMVLAANGTSMTTISLRPSILYGELDLNYMARFVKVARRLGGYMRFNCKNGRQTHVYVGNVAWCFVNAENVLYKDKTRAKRVGGHAFFACDNTPQTSMFEFHHMFFKPMGIRPFPIIFPTWLVIFGLYLLYPILYLISFVYRVNVNVSPAPFKMMTRTYIFGYEKAHEFLNYQPLFSFEEAKNRSIMFLSSLT